MKKLIVILVLAIFASVGISVTALELGLVDRKDANPTYLSYVEPEDGSTPYFVKKYVDTDEISDEPLKVITFTDTHIGNGKEASDVISLTIIDRVIKEKQPDLVVITGDVCLGSEALSGVDALAKVFETNKTYWAVVLGNHDAEAENGPTREELIRYYEAKPYSLTKEGPIDQGEGNYMINHVTTKGVTHTLVFIDSGAYVTPETCAQYGYKYVGGYDFVKPEQMEWYTQTLTEIKESNGGVMPESTMFMHIPVVEHHYIDNNAYLYGAKLEPSCPSDINSGLF
ncbi:MAG: metallophosphoesterase, partial [Clostridia bacterium]|nr:metallophosphoesterase [Clostridia bacterium]